MSNDKPKGGEKNKPAGKGSGPAAKPSTPAPPAPYVPPPALFRRIDWITGAVTTLIMMIGYWLTLSPDLGLEDSGELAVASYYAGVPHPPGYPVWTIYTWLFTLIPFSNIAWRVSLSSAVAAALACGLLGLLVSRGSSMLLEGINEFKNIDRRLESLICVLSGFISGTLLGFNGFMWSQAVIVEVYTLSVLSFMGVLCCLLRWIYAPEQRKYLYWAFFWFGICFTNHQTLIVAAMGIEVAVLMAAPKLGRDMFIGNTLVYLLGLIGKAKGTVTTFDQNLPLFMVFNAVGLLSAAVAVMMLVKCGPPRFQLKWGFVPWSRDWTPVMICLLLWFAGAFFYFYMPVTSMTNPPLNWGYPRTEEGFWHALTRGQYDKTNPTDDPFKFIKQVGIYFDGAVDEFSLVYLAISIVPFLFFQRMQKRERAWIVGLTAIYLLLAFLLLILLNPNTDRQSANQTRVFFTASHIILSILIGYGVTLIGGMAALLYERWRQVLLWSGAVACAFQLFFTLRTFENTQFALIRTADLLCLLATGMFTLTVLFFRRQVPLGVLLAAFAFAPVRSVLSNWSDAEQRGHLFGFWFGHDMFTPPFNGQDGQPLYPEMTRNAILFGGTDPGRFNPTYMIFAESFIPDRCKRDPNFDRRDVYLITQNALADKTYLDYIRAHYNRSAQNDPYFFSEFFRPQKETDEGRTNLLARMFVPLDRFLTQWGENVEKRRRAQGVYPPKEILTPTTEDSNNAFTEYITDAQQRLQHDMMNPEAPRRLKPGEDVRIDGGRVQVSGQVAVMAINALLTKIIFDKNPDHEFFVEESFPLDWMFPHLTPFGIIMKINRQPVPEYTEEMLNRDHEFWSQFSARLIGNWITYDTPVKDICDFALKTYQQRDFTGFIGDRKFVRDEVAQKSFSKLRSAIAGIYSWRLTAPDCPPQFRPKSPEAQARLFKEAEFAFRQAFAFCPYSPEAIYKYVQLLTSVGRLNDALLVAETGLKFDLANDALRNLVTTLRSMRPNMAQFQAQMSAAQEQLAQLEQQFRAAPTNLALGLQLATAYQAAGRVEAATPVLDQLLASPALDVKTLLEVAQIYAKLGQELKVEAALKKMAELIPPAEAQRRANTNDLVTPFTTLLPAYIVAQRSNDALRLTEELIGHPNADPNTFLSAASVFAQLQDHPRLEGVLKKLVTALPNHPEAWYDLAAVQITLGKTNETLASLRKAIDLSTARQTGQPGSKGLRATAASDLRFASLQANPDFQRIVKGR